MVNFAGLSSGRGRMARESTMLRGTLVYPCDLRRREMHCHTYADYVGVID